MITLSKKCACCGAITAVEVSEEAHDKYISGSTVLDAFPELNVFDREVLISSMCYDCISKNYNIPKPGEDWGEQVGECECCGAPIWKKDYDENNMYKCVSCGLTYSGTEAIHDDEETE